MSTIVNNNFNKLQVMATTKENKNLAFYEELREVPKEAQKSFSNGRFSGTDINPMWRIKKLTEMFGVCGVGWYFQPVHRHIETASDGTKCAFVSINLYVKVEGEWSHPIYGEGGNTFETKTSKGYIQVSDEAYKMALTDAISNATKNLGLGADVWFERDKVHSTKYDVQQENLKLEGKEPAKTQTKKEPKTEVLPLESGLTEIIASINAAKTVDDVKSIWESNKELQSNTLFRDAIGTKGKELKAQEGAA